MASVRTRPVDPVPYLRDVAVALAGTGQPEATLRALDRAMGAALGHRLFTVLLRHPQESERRYSSRPGAYPVGGRKPATASPWTEQVFGRGEPYIGRTAADIRAVFPDHELIASLGCASVLNLPVAWNGRVLGTINLLHEADWYDERDVPVGLAFAALAVPAYLAC